MPLTADVSLNVAGRHTSALDLGTAALPFGLSAVYSFANGTGVGQADRVFTDRRTLAASASENLDFAGVLLDAYGAVLTFATIKAILVKAAATNTNNVDVTRHATTGVPIFMAAGDGVSLKPGASFAVAMSGAGVAVTPSTGDMLTVTNSAGGTEVVYDIVVIGTSV